MQSAILSRSATDALVTHALEFAPLVCFAACEKNKMATNAVVAVRDRNAFSRPSKAQLILRPLTVQSLSFNGPLPDNPLMPKA